MVRETLKVLVTGGGTAGHVVPVLTVVDELRRVCRSKRQPLEVLFVGRRNSPEQLIVERSGIVYAAVSSGKLRRYVDLQNLLDPLRVMVGFFQALVIVMRFRPDVVFAKGGYVSVPIVAAARLLGRPVVAHETDAVIGLANRLAVRMGALLCTGYPKEAYALTGARADRYVWTGNPVQPEFFRVKRPIRSGGPFTLLVVGGSQGARSINRVVRSFVTRPVRGLAIIHLTGPAHYDEFASLASTWYHPIGYTDHMVDLLGQADLVVSRSGGSVFELAAAGRPSILIPLSSSANRHQSTNATYFAQRTAAVVIDEAELTERTLRTTVERLLRDVAERRRLSGAIGSLAVPNATEQVVRQLLGAAKVASQYRGQLPVNS